MGTTEDESLGSRIERVADRLFDGNLSELARNLDMQPSSFYKYVDGRRRPGMSVLTRIARLGVNMNWFLSGKGHMLQPDQNSTSPLPVVGPTNSDEPDVQESLQRVPLVRVEAGDGDRPVLREVGGAEWLSASFVRRSYGVEPDRLKSFRVSGNAMEDALRAGDRVRGALWQGESLTDGAIYLIYREPGTILRRVHLSGERIRLIGEHPDVEPIAIRRDEWRADFRPIAQMMEVVRAL